MLSKKFKFVLQYFIKGEITLWCISVILIVVSFFIFDRENFLTLVASLIGVTSLIFSAKGNPFGQFLMIIFSVLYGIISFYNEAKKAFETSLNKLGLEYIELYLIHQPMGDYIGAYRAMEELYKEGLIRAIGVCNFYPHVLADFCETVEVFPTVNQIELHPFFQQEDALKLMKEYGVIPEAWALFAEGNHNIFTHPVLSFIGEKYGKSAAQVALRWNVQRGVVVIPKSIHKNRMEQNIDIWDLV